MTTRVLDDAVECALVWYWKPCVLPYASENILDNKIVVSSSLCTYQSSFISLRAGTFSAKYFFEKQFTFQNACLTC